MTSNKFLILTTALLLTSPLGLASANAQTPATTPAAPAVDDAFAGARDSMHKDMMGIKATGNIDKDFILNMIPHHKAAIEMAGIALKESKDTVTRRVAQNIIGAQKAEIKQMEARLKQLDK